MKMYHFELVLERALEDDEEDRLYERLHGQISSAWVNGIALLYVHLYAESMEQAIREAASAATELGVAVRRIELDPRQVIDDAA